jgi:hypothetical protein
LACLSSSVILEMKERVMKKSSVAWSVVVVSLLACVSANGAIVDYLGSDVSTGAAWRTSTVTKPATFDPNGDGGYGSEGNYVYYMQNDSGLLTEHLSNSSPAYASVSQASGVSKYANPSYGRIDDPTSPIGAATWEADRGYFYNWAYGPSYANLLTVTLTSNADFVMGAIVGGSTMSPDGLRVLQTVGGSAEALADTSGTPRASGGRLDYYFFHVAGVAGDQFVVSGYATDRDAGISGITFESTAVPEPSTLALVTIGAAGLLAYAWRRWR